MSVFQTQHLAGAVRSSPGEVPRRRVDRETTPGRCGNLDYCSIGMQRVLVHVAVSQPFICPECGSPLRPPGKLSRGSRPLVLPVLRIGVLVGAMAVSLAVGYTLGRVQHRVGQAVQSVAIQADAGLTQAGETLGLTPAAAPAPAPARPAPTLVAERPYSVHTAGLDAAAPAPHLLHEARFGQVTIDCGLDQAFAHPACQVSDIRGGDAFSTEAIAWLQGLSVQYAPGGHAAGVPAPNHRWHVVLEDFVGTSRRVAPAP